MKPVDTLYNLWRKHFGQYRIDDPRPIAVEAPYTFYLPSEARLAAIEPDDSVKLIFRGSPKGLVHDAERMWVIVQTIHGDDFIGWLDNDPFDMPQIRHGDRVKFKRRQVIQTSWKDKNKEARIPAEPSKQYWDRCIVDAAVLNGTARVQFLYREEPDMTQDGDKYPDSGWRIRAHVDDLTSEEYESGSPEYTALGKVLNKDDSWLNLIDEPPGTAWFLNDETHQFEPTEFTAGSDEND
ncbi:MAG: hypothetical protein CMK07_05360 [Ponticaulis sp.]|nr:hypothetical protein [Ponticaulis sp.]